MSKIMIGPLLKKKRKELNLSQENFVKDVLSVSQYSRVEQGKQDLKVGDLLKILINNNIEINSFFDELATSLIHNHIILNSTRKLFNDLVQNYYDGKIEEVKKIRAKIRNKNGFENKLWELRAELMIAVMDDSLSNVDSELINRISDELNKSDDWVTDKNFLQLFGSSMLLFDMQRLNIYMKSIVMNYRGSLGEKDFITQRRIAGICINYLTRCYKDKSYDYVAITLQLLKELSQNPDLLMYKMLGVYFNALFSDEKNEVKQIRGLLKANGYSDFLANLP